MKIQLLGFFFVRRFTEKFFFCAIKDVNFPLFSILLHTSYALRCNSKIGYIMEMEHTEMGFIHELYVFSCVLLLVRFLLSII